MSKLADLLLEWYALNARELPWRRYKDPYAIWVSEIMLQQTRVESVIPYFEKWMETFPSVSALANASEPDVLSAWEGLGYYSRARNLRKSAQKIIAVHNGKMPDNLVELIKLPGIGRYTAGAIASIAFNANVSTVDGNIRRVIARLYDIKEVVNSPEGEKLVWGILEKELPGGKAGDFNQALMDLGSLLCTPKSPQCQLCPLFELCLARSKGLVGERPILNSKPYQPHFSYVGAIINKDDNYLLTKRPSRGLLGGLWEFPNERVENEEDLSKKLTQIITNKFGIEVVVSSNKTIIKHAYSHFRLTLHAYSCTWVADIEISKEICAWVPLKELLNYPMGKVARHISRILISDGK